VQHCSTYWVGPGTAGYADNLGICLTSCDPLSGSPCAAVDGGVAQVCLPDFALWFITGNGPQDHGWGLCAAQTSAPLPVGSPCAPINGSFVYPSPCVAGAMCWNSAGSNDWRCQQLCALDGSAPCAGDAACRPMDIAPGLGSTTFGVCTVG
jgi:hypothetical protein